MRTMQKTDWHLLESFRIAGRLQHVTRAAEELGTSQPALSRALARLQAELGIPLFERVGRSLRLTRYGELFLARVERALAEIEEGRRELADLTEPERGVVALVFVAVPPGRPGLEWVRVFDQELVLIVPRTHTLAQRRQVRLREVAGEPFVLFKEGHAIRRMTDDLCRLAGF